MIAHLSIGQAAKVPNFVITVTLKIATTTEILDQIQLTSMT